MKARLCFLSDSPLKIGKKRLKDVIQSHRSSPSEMLLQKGVPKMCSKFTGEHSCRSAISIKLQSNFIEITLRHGCAPVNLLHIFWSQIS